MSPSSSRSGRIVGLDIARGLAIALMFLSHTVKGLLPFKMMPSFGIVPIHAITKFSSSLFVIVFGMTLAVVYLPHVRTRVWPLMRWKIWKRAVIVMFWYKALIIVQMFQRSRPQAIIDTVLWKRFPDFVEILQFYAWFLLLVPIFLPGWSRLSLWSKILVTYAVGLTSYVLQQHVDFAGVWQLKAILVEYRGTFCFGVLTRGTMVLFGLMLGELLVVNDKREEHLHEVAGICVVLGIVCLGTFFAVNAHHLLPVLRGIAFNHGKHPPRFVFMAYSIGGALLLAGALLPVRGGLAKILAPLAIVGRESLFCFCWHIVVIFVGYRYLLGLRHQVTYTTALMLTAGVFGSAVMAAALYSRTKRQAKKRPGWRLTTQNTRAKRRRGGQFHAETVPDLSDRRRGGRR